jgi:GNAT superfamily N-acetyltransferase
VEPGGGTGNVRLRPASVDQVETLSALAVRSKAHWGYDDAFIDACREELRVGAADIGPHRLTVAIDDTARILGFYGLVGTSDADAELSALFVEPEAIGTGVGRLLFDGAVRVAVAAGFRRFRIEADPFAAAFYESMGAVRTGSTPSASIAGRELPLYVMDLSGSS